jgi:hypothetical protein
MVDQTEGGTRDPERLTGNTEAMKDAWGGTLSDMRAREAAYEERGWTVQAVAAGQTTPESPDLGPDGRFGFVHIVPGDDAVEIEAAIEAGRFDEYDVFRATVDGRVFLVTELLDSDHERAILVAGTYELGKVGPLVEAADEAGVCYTHLQRLDGTPVGSFEHRDYEKFIPRIEAFRN